MRPKDRRGQNTRLLTKPVLRGLVDVLKIPWQERIAPEPGMIDRQSAKAASVTLRDLAQQRARMGSAWESFGLTLRQMQRRVRQQAKWDRQARPLRVWTWKNIYA